jgi:hypothetical protein
VSSIAVIDFKIEIFARLREYRVPIREHGKLIYTFIGLEQEGTEIREHLTMTVTGAGTCTGEGFITTSTSPGESGVSHGSAIWLKSARQDTTPLLGWDIPQDGGLYLLALAAPERNEGYTDSCGDKTGYLGATVGRIPLNVRGSLDPLFRSLGANGGQMSGSYRAPSGTGYQVSVVWNICREGVACADPGEPGAPPDPCGDPSVQQALLDQCQEAERAIERQMKPMWDEYQAQMSEAAKHQSDYVKAAHLCTAWNWTMKALGALVGAEAVWTAGLSATQAAEVKEFLEAVAYLKDVGQNAAEGKSVLQALQPEQLKQIADSGETITNFLAALHQFLAGQTPEQMGAGLEDCGRTVVWKKGGKAAKDYWFKGTLKK